MKKILWSLLGFAALSAAAGTVPLYLTGAAGSSYAVTAAAIVTATNTSVTYTNYSISCTNAPAGTEGSIVFVSWRSTAKTYTITNATPVGDQIAAGATTNSQAFNLLAQLQNDFPAVRVGEFSAASLTVSAPTADALIFTNSPGVFSVTPSSYFDNTNAAQTVTLLAAPSRLVTNTIIYVSGASLNTNTLILTTTLVTNTIVLVH